MTTEAINFYLLINKMLQKLVPEKVDKAVKSR